MSTYQKSGVWQFYQDGEWRVGTNHHNHRENTENAGYPTRDLYFKMTDDFSSFDTLNTVERKQNI